MSYFEIISKYFQRWGCGCRLFSSVAVKNRRKATQKICATPRNFEFTQNALSRSRILQQISGSIHAETSATCRFSSFSVLRRVWIWASGWCTTPPSHTHRTLTSIQLDYLKYFGRSAAIELFLNYFEIIRLGQRRSRQVDSRFSRQDAIKCVSNDLESVLWH